MPTAKKKAPPKKAAKKSVKKVAKTAKKHSAPKTKKVVQKSAPVTRAPAKVHAGLRPAAHPSNDCREGCRICGTVCFRSGLHEQHRCRDHVGLSM
jgi:hypothetical protein